MRKTRRVTDPKRRRSQRPTNLSVCEYIPTEGIYQPENGLYATAHHTSKRLQSQGEDDQTDRTISPEHNDGLGG